jgi:Spy/CpxP family protein refolding chaperone
MQTQLTAVAISVGLYVILSAAPAEAHHAFAAAYDAAKTVRLRGTVAKIEWINPHAWIHIEVKKNDGKTDMWMIETAAPNVLLGRGITKDFLKLGTEVGVDGYQAKDGSLRIHGRELTLPNGQPVFVGSTGIGAPYDDANANPNVVQDDRRVVRTQVAGAWWTNGALMQRLGLTNDQKVKIERTFENHRVSIVSTTNLVEKEEAQLARLMETEPVDRNALFAQIDRVIQARSEMERANAAMTVEIREHLTRAQWLLLPRTSLTITPAGATPPPSLAPPTPGQRRGQ